MNLTFHNYLTKLFTLSAFIGVFLLVSQTTLKAQELPTQFEFEHLTQTYEEFDDGNQVPVYQLIQEEYTYPSFDIYPSSEEDFAFSYMGSPVEQYNSIQTMASSIERNHCGAMTIGEFGSPFLEIHPYLARLVDRGYLDAEVLSEISYKIEGETGSQIMKIQWKNWGFHNEIQDDGISTDFVNFQIWFYEQDNSFEIHYGPSNITQPELDYGYSLPGDPVSIGFFNRPLCALGWFSQGQGVDEQSYYSLIGGDVNDPSINNVLAFGATEGYDAEGLYLNDFDFVAPNPNYPQSILDEWFFNEATIPDGTVLRFGAPGMVVGLNDVETQFINVYPNPVEDFLYLDLPDNAQASQIDVFSLDGKVQKTFSGQSVQELLYLADLEKGLYILKVEAEGQEFTAKVLKD